MEPELQLVLGVVVVVGEDDSQRDQKPDRRGQLADPERVDASVPRPAFTSAYRHGMAQSIRANGYVAVPGGIPVAVVAAFFCASRILKSASSCLGVPPVPSTRRPMTSKMRTLTLGSAWLGRERCPDRFCVESVPN